MLNCYRNGLVTFCIVLYAVLNSYGQITADFTSGATEACANLKVDFYDQSTLTSGSISSWEWELGESFSSKQNPGKIFSDPGSYTICLTITDNNGNTDKICKENYINIYPNPIAEFVIDQTEGCAPVSVNITDLSTTGNTKITNWIWDLGGSANVIETSVPGEKISTTYKESGLYSMSLSIEDDKGCTNTVLKRDIVKVSESIPLDIDYNIIISCGFPWVIQFNNLSPEPDIQYTWNFGNGNTFDGAFPPLVEYYEEGDYDVTLITSNGECVDTTVFENYINTDRENNYQLNSDIVCAGSPISFTDVSTTFADSIKWIFGDGTISSAAEPIHTYDSEGCYPIVLIRYRSECIDTVIRECIQVLPNPEISYSIDNQFTCGVPTTVVLNGSTSRSGVFEWRVTGKNFDELYSGDKVNVTIEDFGEYQVSLNYTDDSGCVAVRESIDLDIIPYSVELPRKGLGGCIPLTVTMVDSIESVVPIEFWDWKVYDNGTIIHNSNEATPSFLFPDIGQYDVQLIVENIYGCRDTVFRSHYIEAGIKPNVDFMADPLESCIVDLKQFTDLSDSITNSWNWSFGDSTTSEVQNPEKLFSKAGSYDVTLLAFHNGCGNSITKSDYINILAPRSLFAIEYNCENPYTVDIINRTSGADSLGWKIAMGPNDTLSFSDSLLMPITFPNRGKYPVYHYSKNDSTGCEHTFIDTVRITDPIAAYELDTARGCLPLIINVIDQSKDASRYLFTGEGAKISRDTFFDPLFTYSVGGSYAAPFMKVTDIHACSDSIQLPDSIFVNDISASAEFSNVICSPSDFIPISTSTSTFSNIINYLWTINDTLLTSTDEISEFLIGDPGLYDLELKIIDDWNCTSTQSYPMAVEAIELVPDFTADPLSCTYAPIRFRAKNVSENVDSFYWDFGDGNYSSNKNINYTYSTEGIYTVCLTMIDKRGCSQSICKDSIVTIQNPIAEFSGDPVLGTCPPLLSNFENLSTNGSSYLWDFGDNAGNSTNENPSHVYTEPGIFDVTLISKMTSLCADTIVKNSYVSLEGPKGFFEQFPDSTCMPLSVIINTQSDEEYNYIYDFGNGELDSLENKVNNDIRVYTYEKTGRYTPKVIITDDKGCSRALVGDQVEVNTIDLEFEISDTSFCNSFAEVELTNLTTSTSPQVEYMWTISGPQQKKSTFSEPSFILDSLGIYDVTLLAKTANCIDTLVHNELLEISSNPAVDFTIVNDQLCDGIDVHFINNSAVEGGLITSYDWDFGDGNTSEMENPSHTYESIQSFSVTLTAATRNGCKSSFSMVIPISPSTIGYAGTDDTICIGDDISLFASVENLQDGGDFYWEPKASLSCDDCLDPVATPIDNETYTFIAVHPNGCESIDSVFITVVQEVGPTLSLAGDSTICLGDEAIFTIENYDSSFIYTWEDENNLLDCTFNCSELKASPVDTTDFFVVIENEYGCIREDTFTVYVETEIGNILIEDKTICVGSQTELAIENGIINFWESGNNITCLDCPNPIVSPLESSHYYVNVISDEGCAYRDSILVNVIQEDAIDAGIDGLICVGESFNLQGKGVGSPTWHFDTTIIKAGEYNHQIKPTQSSSYTLQTIVGECTMYDTITIDVESKAIIESIGDTICPGDIAQLNALPIMADRFWWEDEDGDKIMGELNIQALPDTTATYMLIGEFRSCENDTAYTTVSVLDKIEAYIIDSYVIYADELLQLNIEYGQDKIYDFSWQPSEGLDCYNCPDPYILDISGNMTYTVNVSDPKTGCKISEDVFVKFINDCNKSVYFMPNIFSPNDDGINDQFRIFTEKEEDFRGLHVYDRWGNQVFSAEDINSGWNGLFKGNKLLPGVYSYMVDAYCDVTGKEFYFLGDVTLIR